MSLPELILTAIGLSMDAFAVAMCIGLSLKTMTVQKALLVGLYFGIFQAGMPLIGYWAGAVFADKISAFDHWIAFALLAFIGAKMVKDSFSGPELDGGKEANLGFQGMLPLAIATSIDALAVGVSFAFLKVSILPAVLLIGLITLFLSMTGVKLGNLFGVRFQAKATLAGGLVLILLGTKILLEHTGILSF